MIKISPEQLFALHLPDNILEILSKNTDTQDVKATFYFDWVTN